MPIQSCTLPGGGQGFKWGESGHCYPTRAQAEKQAEAAYANGYAGKVSLTGRLKKQEPQRTTLCALVKNLDQAAHAAATSPLNLRRQPTEGQRSAGNYKKGHVEFAGLRIGIENPAGSYRRPEWPPMKAHYGYVKSTEGADGDGIDVFLKPSTPMDWNGLAYVIDQDDQQGTFDEHKVMLGYESQGEAIKAYLSHYPKDWRLGPVTAMTLDQLRDWLQGDTTQPVTKEWTASSSATSGITAYGNTPKRKKKRVKLLPLQGDSK